MNNKDLPDVHFYDQDFVDLYNKTWAWISNSWVDANTKAKRKNSHFYYEGNEYLSLLDTCLASFFLVYSNSLYKVDTQLDYFYALQEGNGAIRGKYSIKTGEAVFSKNNPEAVQPPLLALAEFNLFHKVGNKKRLKDVMPYLENYFSWLEETFRQENGLYSVPVDACFPPNSPRLNVVYPVDFNSQQAVNSLYMSAIGDILNDKEMSFKYKRHYFSLKTRINKLMWDEESGFYHDLDENENKLLLKTIAGFWPMLAEIPNEDKASALIRHLKNPNSFGTENPFPTLAADEPGFDPKGAAAKGAVYPAYTFMVIKGLEKYGRYELARECAIRHIYFILDTLHPEKKKGDVYEAYKPMDEGPAVWEGHPEFPRPRYLPSLGLSTITLMIENIIGLYVSLPRKTVDWIIPSLEIMGIENLSLKRNMITILSNKSNRGWEIRLESEKLYYFTINILGEKKKKTLPIPSGKCSMLIDKL